MKMKRKGLFLLILAALVFSACQSLFVEDRAGQVIRFSASAGNGMETRTNYSGDKDDVTNKERIDWLTGDKVKVYLYLDKAPGYYWDHISSDYKVTLIHEGNPKYISKGTLDSEGTSSLKWVGTADDHVAHWFYSIYPADYRGELYKDTDGSMKVDFNGLAEQDGTMDYAYMAAVAGGPYYTDGKENPNSNEDMVNLDYYPMITTVYVTVENASGKDLNLSIRLSSKEDTTPLAGPYTVTLNGNSNFTPIVNTESGTFVDQLNQSLSLSTSGEAAKKSVKFFLLPVNYTTSNLNLTLSDGNKTYSFNLNESGVESLQAFHKYNVSVKLNKSGSEFDGLTEAGLQLALGFLRMGKIREPNPNWDGNPWWGEYNEIQIDGNYLAPFFKDLYPDSNDFLNFYNTKFMELCNLLPNVKEGDRKRLVTDEEWQIFLNILASIEEFIIKTEDKINMDFTQDDLNFLPNLKYLELQYDNSKQDENGKEIPINISLTKMSPLQELVLRGNALLNLTIDQCEELLKVDLGNLNTSKPYVVNINRCYKLQTIVDIPNNSVWSKTVTNCNSNVNTQ